MAQLFIFLQSIACDCNFARIEVMQASGKKNYYYLLVRRKIIIFFVCIYQSQKNFLCSFFESCELTRREIFYPRKMVETVVAWILADIAY